MAVKKWLNPYSIDCSCGHVNGGPFAQDRRMCATKCMGNFKATDYPPGYFSYVGQAQLRKNTIVNTCPPCETEVLRTFLARMSLRDGRVSEQDRSKIESSQASIILLEEWKLAMPHQEERPRQEKRVRKLYGDDVLRVMHECADETDRTKVKRIITEEICKAMTDFPPPRFQHKRLVEDLGPICQGCSLDFSLNPLVLEVDHIRPKSDGGTDAYDNLTLLCPPCNRKKGNHGKLEDLWPRSPNRSYWDSYLREVAELAEQDKANEDKANG